MISIQEWLGAIDNGIGYTHVNGFLSTLNIPTINKTAYKNREREVGKAIEEVAINSCQMVLEDEIYQAENNGKIRGDDGLMPLSVSYDIQWLKRGRANNSLTGHGAIMGTNTKKVLDFCRICEASKTKGKEPSCHDRPPASSVGRASDYRAGGLGFEPQTGPTLRVLK